MKRTIHDATSLLVSALCFFICVPQSFGQESQPKVVTAKDVLDRMKGNLGVPWQDGGMDGFKAGGPESEVKGVVVTLFPTYRVLKQAAESGHNLVICHEPLFYAGCADKGAENDKVLSAKRKLISDNGLVVYRFHDNIHRMKPDGIHRGMISKLKWKDYLADESGSNQIFKVPETTLEDFAKDVSQKLNCAALRVIGDPKMRFSKMALSAGAWWAKDQIKLLRRDDVEVLVIGESREWQTIEYVRDAVDSGQLKALVVIGHNASEEAGMQWCAKWLQTFVTKLPVKHLPSGEPYWSPQLSAQAPQD